MPKKKKKAKKQLTDKAERKAWAIAEITQTLKDKKVTNPLVHRLVLSICVRYVCSFMNEYDAQFSKDFDVGYYAELKRQKKAS